MAGLRAHKRLPMIAAFLLVAFLYLKKGKQLRNYELFLPHQEPKEVWNVLADFSNIAQMNTRIDHWELLDLIESPDHWSYRLVTYEGMVGQWLFGLNENRGEMLAEPVSPPDHYYIQESYLTTSLRGLLLIKNHGITNIRRSQQEGQPGTLVVLDTGSDCPLLFHYVCVIETDLNRRVFLANLREWFDKK
ncbi:uncharacterized protein LOC123517204 isoform X1 [Portunus trituberculatus]|uniref:uncharacterized protein LOC123517204 isoform X1 n=1 Tax=Portunus trituberculatus TaxID=210409 RepID=UPI001E1D1F36|nr:uncharacterized protein LOC123517204 isoform X1 [Portunus trituberculatus]